MSLATQGLSAADVVQRVAEGKANNAPDARSRSLGSIIRSNLFTWFNGLIFILWIAMIAVAPIQDSLFGFVIVANTLIGVIQEWRASQTLAKLSLIGEAKPIVRRDGVDVEVRPAEVVLDDIIILRSGDQLVVDGVVVESVGLEIDESLLTGEADPVDKAIDDSAMSGSFVVAGGGLYRATRVGRDSFAAGLTEQAKKFQQTNSELRDSVAKFIRVISYALLPVGALLLWSQIKAVDAPDSGQTIRDAIRGTIAGVVTMVPEGLVLLTSIAMAVAVVRLARYKVLVQDMPAVEVLARVDMVCVDKTGTLTEPGMHVRDVISLVTSEPIAEALGAMGASEGSPNPTLQAVAEAYPKPAWSLESAVPFSSARKWSSATFDQHGTWLLGAPEMLLLDDAGASVRAQAEEIASAGSRVLLLARSSATPDAGPDVERGPGPLSPVALVVIDQKLRDDAAETVAYFLEQGVHVTVISGDNPGTVGAIAAQAGVPGADIPVDARTLPEDIAQLATVLDSRSVFGRVTPLQKQAMVDALHLRGRTVAMTGDGVNDVLALKHADLGIAMGSGSGATRAVAQLVLLNDKFSVMPHVVAEGRKVLGNIERVSDVFLTKTFYAIFISLMTAGTALLPFLAAPLDFPFLPRHLTLIGALTIGIPGFFLALMPNKERFRPGFFKRVLLFTVPAGAIAAVSAMLSYYIALPDEGATSTQVVAAQGMATVTLFIVTTAVLLQSARPLNLIRLGIVALMIGMFLGVLLIPFFAKFFALQMSWDGTTLMAVIIGLVGSVLVWIATLITDRWRRA